jgi:hypothetical protein
MLLLLLLLQAWLLRICQISALASAAAAAAESPQGSSQQPASSQHYTAGSKATPHQHMCPAGHANTSSSTAFMG